MVFKCEVEIDWIDEDCTIEDMIKKDIASQVAHKVAGEHTEIVKIARTGLETEITKFVANHIKRFMEETITITDQWGDPIKGKEDITIKDLIKRKFDTMMSVKVDENGRVNSSSYNNKYILRDWLIGKAVEKEVESNFKDFSKTIKEAVASEMNKKIKEEVSDNFATLLVNLNKTKLLK